MKEQNQISEVAKEAATLEIQQNLDVSFGKGRGKFVQSAIDADTEQLRAALQRLIHAVNVHLLCGRPEIKTVDDVINGMRVIAEKLDKVCIDAATAEVKKEELGSETPPTMGVVSEETGAAQGALCIRLWHDCVR